MPLCSDNETVDVVLETDADKPEATRPTFLARFLTGSESRKVGEHLQQASKLEAGSSAEMDLLDAVLAIQYAGWRNMNDRSGDPIPFRVEDGRLASANDALTYAEKWDLVGAAAPATHRGYVERKVAIAAARAEKKSPEAVAGNVANSKPDSAQHAE